MSMAVSHLLQYHSHAALLQPTQLTGAPTSPSQASTGGGAPTHHHHHHGRSLLRDALNVSHVLTDGAAAIVDDSFLKCFATRPGVISACGCSHVCCHTTWASHAHRLAADVQDCLQPIHKWPIQNLSYGMDSQRTAHRRTIEC